MAYGSPLCACCGATTGSQRGIARALNARGVAPGRGGVWSEVQVAAILRRAGCCRTEDRAQAQAFIDTWVWDSRAVEGFEEIVFSSNPKYQNRLHTKAGTVAELDELAVWMDQTASGGTFRTRVGAARMFGLIETSQGRATLTQLGREMLDKSGLERAARVTAFLNVELFRALYEQNKGNALPPPPAIERQIGELGVSPRQLVRARQTFTKSAQYAGFIDPTSGRFVKPGIPDQPNGTKNKTDEPGGGGGGDGAGPGDFSSLVSSSVAPRVSTASQASSADSFGPSPSPRATHSCARASGVTTRPITRSPSPVCSW